MNVNPGELRKSIQIFKKIGETDRDGYASSGYELVHACKAKFTRTSGTEVVRANADFSELKVRFLIRYTRKKLDRKMRVRYAGQEYEIGYINDYEDRHEYVELWCKDLTLEG